MKKISDYVEHIIRADYVALSAFRRGHLNMNAYAAQILPEIEGLCLKEVKQGSIVVALFRLGQKICKEAPLSPAVKISDITMQSPLLDITFDRTVETLQQLVRLRSQLSLEEHDFFTVTEGKNEITIIAPQRLRNEIEELFDVPPRALLEYVVAVTVSFSSKYLSVPNVIFCLLKPLAVRQINLIEVVSTYTQLSVIVSRSEADAVISALQSYLE